MVKIHQTAIVDSKAQIADNVEIGPYCTVGPKVVLDSGVRLISHVTVDNKTTIGENTIVHPFAVVGGNSQHKAYINDGDSGTVTIGKNNTIREYVSIHIGTPIDKSQTIIGDNCLLMGGVHIAHDCILGNDIILSNNATLGGHVKVEDFAVIGGMSAIHQFCRVGKMAMLGGMSALTHDIIPYGLFMGSYSSAHLRGLNLVALKRRGFAKEEIATLMSAYKMLFNTNDGVFAERVTKVEENFSKARGVMDIINFIKTDTEKTIAMPLANEVE